MIYFICPTTFASGGPVAIHQFAYKLIKMGINAAIYYFNPDKHELDDQLKIFNIPSVEQIEDSKSNLVVIPELLISTIFMFSYAKRVIWWLSVDNAVWDDTTQEDLCRDETLFHFSQSAYSSVYLTHLLRIPAERVFYVSDYLNPIYLNVPTDWKENIDGQIVNPDTIVRERTILFNPKKGFGRTQAVIMMSDGSVKWQALNGMTPQQMRNAMKKAMVYIDFGGHPGMDRIPREAALSGCCVFTNRRGSAGNGIDVPIPDKCKIDDEADPKEIFEKICGVMDDYRHNYEKMYGHYVEIIKGQFKLFEISIIKAISSILNIDLLNSDLELSQESLIEQTAESFEKEDYFSAFRKVVIYRYRGFEENETYKILEASVRIAFGEFEEAEYCIRQGIKMFPKSYELYLMLAQLLMSEGTDKVEKNESDIIELKECLNRAIEFSKSTDDEENVENFVNCLKTQKL